MDWHRLSGADESECREGPPGGRRCRAADDLLKLGRQQCDGNGPVRDGVGVLTNEFEAQAAGLGADAAFFKDAALQTRFDDQGYVVVDLLDAAEVEQLVSASRNGKPAYSPPNDPANATYMSVYDKEHLPIADRVLKPRLDTAMRRHVSGYRALIGVFFVKEPNTQALPIHQHPPSLFDLTDVAICCWCALNDIDEANGVLRVVPRSHRITRHVETARFRPYFADFAQRVYEAYSVPVPVRAGQAVIFDNSLLHGSGPNVTNRRRTAVFSLLIPEDKQHVHIADERGFEFEAIAIDEPFGAPEIYGGPLPDHLKSRSLGRIDARQSPMTEDEFAELLRRNQRISSAFDPLDALRAERQPRSGWKEGNLLSAIRGHLAAAAASVQSHSIGPAPEEERG